MRRLVRADYTCGAGELAPALLGCTLVRILDDGRRLAGVIIETEAYLGVPDAAAHSFKGRRTARTEPMFGPPGTAYVYFTYGMHHCMNVAAAEEGVPEAVLLRALEPAEGVEAMRRLREGGRKTPAVTPGGDKRGETGRMPVPPRAFKDVDLCRGPGRLCQAMGITRVLSGEDLTGSDRLWIEGVPGSADPARIGRSARIGVGYAGEWAGRELRFFLCGHPGVSGRRIPGGGGGV